jgi:DMSO reductase family type II enzyme chaperone
MTTTGLPREEVSDEGSTAASARSSFYAHLSRAFAFPQPEFHTDIRKGRWLETQAANIAALPYRLSGGAASGWRAPADYDSFQTEYIRLFEVGARGASSCPLHAGHHTSDRLRAMEELVRFYNFFGLRLSPGLMPDHVTVELEFMHFLAFKEAEARNTGGDVDSYLRAQSDFVQRQLANWWPALVAAVKQQRPLPFYRALVALLARVLDAERTYLSRALRSS